MKSSIIHVHTQADKKTQAYVRFMWATMQELAYAPELLFLHVHCIGPVAAEVLADLKNAKTIVVENTTGGGSFGHGACIMSALSMTDNGCIHVICDSDAFVVAKGWDNYVRKRIAEGIGIMGTTYEDLGGFSSGNDHVQTYKKLPTFTWAAISSDYKWNKLDVMPNKDHRIAINTPLLSQIYKLPVGYAVFGEAAWQLPQFVYDNTIHYEGWKQLKPSKDAIVLKGLTDYHEEYHAGSTGIPFVVHHRGSIKHAYRGNKVSLAFFAEVDKYLEKERSAEPKWVGEIPTNSDTMFQLSFPFGSVLPRPEVKESPHEVIVEPDTNVTGWLKVTMDSTVVRARAQVTESSLQLDYRPEPNKINHVRLEGTMAGLFKVTVPVTDKVHCVTIRNATAATIKLVSGNGTPVGMLDPSAVKMFLVDIDAVIPMS